MVDRDGGAPPSHNANPFGWWSNASFGGAPVLTPTLTFVAQPGGGALTYTGRLQNAQQMKNQATITFPLPAPPGYLPGLTDPKITWFLANQWYRQTYYAVSPGFAPGGVPSGNDAACSPLPATPPCLTVNNLPAPKDDKQAILMLAGRALNGSPRLAPTTTIADYLENANLAAALGTTPFVYEHRPGTPTAINDRVVVVFSPPRP